MKHYIRTLLFVFCTVLLSVALSTSVQASVLDDIESAEEIEIGKTYDAVLNRYDFKWFKLVTDDEYKTYRFSFPSTSSVRLCICDQHVADVKAVYNGSVDTTDFNPGLNETYYISLYNQYTTPAEVLFTVTTADDAPNLMDDAQNFEPGVLIDEAISSEFDKDWFSLTTGDYEEEYTFYTTLNGSGFYTFGAYDSNKKELAKVTCGEGMNYTRDYSKTMKLDRNETYYLCFNANKACEYSFKVTKIAAKKISEPIDLDLFSKKNGFTANWNSISSAKGYELQYSTDSSFKKAKVITTAKKTKKISGLKSGETYYVKVRAYAKNSEGKKIYSKWSKTQKTTIG